MIVEQQVDEGAAAVNVEDVSTTGVAAEGAVSATDDEVPAAVAQALKITKMKQRVKNLERRNKASKLKRLKKVDTAQRIDTSDDTVMDDLLATLFSVSKLSFCVIFGSSSNEKAWQYKLNASGINIKRFMKFNKILVRELGTDLKNLKEYFSVNSVIFLIQLEIVTICFSNLFDGIPELMHVDFRDFNSDMECRIAKRQLESIQDTLGTTPKGGVLLRPERPRTYDDLDDNEKKRFNADVHATNIVLQGLPKDIYKLINHNIKAKAIWNNNSDYFKDKMLLMQTQENGAMLDEEELLFLTGEQTNMFDADVDDHPVKDLALNDDNIFQTDESGPANQQASPSNALILSKVHDLENDIDPCDENHDEHEIHNENSDYFKDKMLLMQAQENGAMLDEKELLFLTREQTNMFDADVDDHPVRDLALNDDNIFQTDECDAFNSDKNIMDSTRNHVGNSNVTLYEQYLSINDVSVVPICESSVSNYAYVLHDNDVYVPHDPLVTELNFYKEQVAIYEQRASSTTGDCVSTQYTCPSGPPNTSNYKSSKYWSVQVRAMKTVFENLEAQVDQNAIDLKSVSRFSDMHEALNAAQKRIAELKSENSNLQNKIQNDDHDVMVKHFPNLRYAIDIKPIPTCIRNNWEVHLDYLKHLKESVETLYEILEEAKVERPLDRSLASTCLYTKHSQELLEYVIGTCLKDFNQ
nr:retrovirus-related Pol polyprotein from transposon TNT 1-94 [Tanacetum cinerariifolium]